MRKIWVVLIGVCWFLGSPIAYAVDSVGVIEPRPGVHLRFLYSEREDAQATVLLYLGGSQKVGIKPSGECCDRPNQQIFTARARPLFKQQKLNVLLVDVPDDLPDGMTAEYYNSEMQAKDAAAVIEWARTKFRKPVWLVGTSMGTFSVSFIATNLDTGGADGIVLTSAIVTKIYVKREPGYALPNNPLRPVWDYPVGKIKVPVLVVHHEEDQCPACRFADVPKLLDALTGVPRKELISFKGGSPSKGGVCHPWSQHGYPGIESEVVQGITDWILLVSSSMKM